MSAAQTAGEPNQKMPKRLEVMIGNELSALSEHVDVSNVNTANQDHFKNAKGNSGLNKQNRESHMNERLKREMDQKQKEMQKQLQVS